MNDRVFTFSALHGALATCRHGDMIEMVARVGLAIDAVTALLPEAARWDEVRAAERRWWVLHGAVESMVPLDVQARLRAGMSAALAAVAHRLAGAADTLDVLAAAQQVIDSIDMEV